MRWRVSPAILILVVVVLRLLRNVLLWLLWVLLVRVVRGRPAMRPPRPSSTAVATVAHAAVSSRVHAGWVMLLLVVCVGARIGLVDLLSTEAKPDAS